MMGVSSLKENVLSDGNAMSQGKHRMPQRWKNILSHWKADPKGKTFYVIKLSWPELNILESQGEPKS